MKFAQTLIMAVVLAVGCTQAPPEPAFDYDAASATISELTLRFTEAHITGDLAFLDSVFAEDARAYAPGENVVAGLAAIAPLNAQWVAYGIAEFSEVSVRRYGGPQAIVDEGTYTMTYGPENHSEAGHYINVWTREGEEWKLKANMWTVQQPLAE